MTKVSNYLESIVFVAGKEIAIDDVREKLGITKKEMDEAIAELKEKYSGECGINLLLFHGKIQFPPIRHTLNRCRRCSIRLGKKN